MSSNSPSDSASHSPPETSSESKASEAEWVQLAAAAQTAAAPVVCRGVRGATTITDNSSPAILEATRDLLERVIAANHIDPEDVASVWFTTTPDITAEYPAVAARQLGWHDAALMCSHEMAVPHGLTMCIRVLIHWNTPRRLSEIKHVYIRGAANLRPDRQKMQSNPLSASSESAVPSPSTGSSFNSPS